MTPLTADTSGFMALRLPMLASSKASDVQLGRALEADSLAIKRKRVTELDLSRSENGRRLHAPVLHTDFGSGDLASAGSRNDCSLGHLTKGFIALFDDSISGIIDLNQAAVSLQVPKRRIYDITNVLEGVGLIEKKSKNNVEWAPASQSRPLEEQIQADIKYFQEEEKALDEHIQRLDDAIKALGGSELFVTDKDLTSLPCFANDSIFAVKAPAGATLDAISEASSRQFRIQIHCSSGPVSWYDLNNSRHTLNRASEEAYHTEQQELIQQELPAIKQEDEYLHFLKPLSLNKKQQNQQCLLPQSRLTDHGCLVPSPRFGPAFSPRFGSAFSPRFGSVFSPSPRAMLGASTPHFEGLDAGLGAASSPLSNALPTGFGGIFNSPNFNFFVGGSPTASGILESPTAGRFGFGSGCGERDPINDWYADASSSPCLPLPELFEDGPVFFGDESSW